MTAATDTTIQFDTVHTVTIDQRFVNVLTRALIDQEHRVIADEIDVRFGDEKGCGGISQGNEACGGCRDCVYLQNTYLDEIGDGYARWQLRAAELAASIRKHLAPVDGAR